ncbi:hypothetical protein JCM10213_004680 [Rhodosporidiobolus nylandii]
MLGAPPIHRPLQPFAFPPPSTSQPDLAPLPVPSSAQAAARPHAERTHRHAQRVREALDLLRRLSDQVDAPAEAGGEEDEQREEGILANLESHGWVHQTTTSGVRIFHSSDPLSSAPSSAASPERTRSVRTSTGRSALSPTFGPASRGLRADETLPFFRGEGWLEGQWNREDVAATICSIGARSAWDPRLDGSRSFVAEHLDDTDSLLHLSIRGTLGSDRDATVVSTTAADERFGKGNVLYVASTSVEDPLLPKTGTRTQITLNGFALRSLPHAPDFEPPAAPESATAPDFSGGNSPPVRPSHRRTRSTMSVVRDGSVPLGTVPLPPLPPIPPEHGGPAPQRPPLLASATHAGALFANKPPPLLHTLSSSTSVSNPDASPSSYSIPLPFRPSPHLAPQKHSSLAKLSPAGPGLAVSMLVRASPNRNLPQTVVNQLSVHLPLAIAAIGRFLSTHGFAPHLLRSLGRAKVREECYDPNAGRHRVVFAVQREQRSFEREGNEEDIRVRFHGASFGRGRFDIEVHNVDPAGWRLKYDHPPRGSEQERVRVFQEDEELGGAGSGQWRSKLSVSMRASGDEGQGRKGSGTSLLSPVAADNSSHDPSLLPGPCGGCTLVLSPSATDPFLPVVITISRSTSDSTTLPLSKMRGMSVALAQAAQVALDDNSTLCDSVEQLLECGREGGEERAEMCLKSARIVLRQLEEAKERETAATAMAAQAAAAAANWGRRSSLASSPSFGGALFGHRTSREGEPGGLVLSSPPPQRRELPSSPLSPTTRLPQ